MDKESKKRKEIGKDKAPNVYWLLSGAFLTLFSVGVIIFTTTDTYCRAGEAVCSSKNWGAYIGILIGVLAIVLSFLEGKLMNLTKTKKRDRKNNRGLIYFGVILAAISIILAIIGFNSKSLNPSGAAMTLGVAMTIISVPLAIAGAIIVCFGIYASKKEKSSNSALQSILTSIYVIGIIAMIFLIFF